MSRILLGLALRLTVLVTSAIVISALLAGSAHASPDGGRLTVVLVHGAWADNLSWDGEVAALQAHGYEVRAIANPLRNLTTDAESVADSLRTIRGPIVLVGHSYGGSVITNAAEGNGEVDGGSHLTLVSHPEAVTAVIQQAIDSVQQP